MNRWKWIPASMLLCAILASCSSESKPAGNSGIRGRALLGPSCPVQTEENPCPDTPYREPILVLRGDDVIATIRPGADGSFRVALNPGAYRLRKPGSAPLPSGPSPETVVVREGAYTEQDLSFDSGIR
ncbi:MAG: hypothetical protein WDA27_11560 [Actinomycetota bacterium]